MRWTVQKGIIAVTTSGKEERLKEYMDSLNFSLTDEEMQKIDEEGKKKSFRKYWQDKEW